MKISTIRVAMLAVSFVGAILAGPAQAAQKIFTSSLNGAYSGIFYDLEWVTADSLGTFKLDGRELFLDKFDGRGNFTRTVTDTLATTSSANPMTVCTGTCAGTYDINGDGTGTTSFSCHYNPNPSCVDYTGTQSFVFGAAGPYLDITWTSLTSAAGSGVTVPSIISSARLPNSNSILFGDAMENTGNLFVRI